jgi:hypothetical protein
MRTALLLLIALVSCFSTSTAQICEAICNSHPGRELRWALQRSAARHRCGGCGSASIGLYPGCPPCRRLFESVLCGGAGGISNSTNLFCFGGSCYHYSMKAAAAAVAHSNCVQAGGALWAPSGDAEAARVQYYFGLLYQRGAIWIGINRTSVAAGWARMDAASLTYTHW